MIAITFALPAESRALISRLQNRREISSAHGDAISGQIGSRSLTIFHTGVGRGIAERTLTEFLDHESFQILISSGFAGGVDDELNVGDLFLAENISDSRLLAIAQRVLGDAHPRVGKLFTSSGIVDSPAQRMKLARSRGAKAIDMETDVIAQICIERGISMLSLRAISDTSRQPFPAPPSVLFDIEQQKIPFFDLATHLVKKPSAIGGLVRFRRQIGRARKNLSDALTSLMQDAFFDSRGG